MKPFALGICLVLLAAGAAVHGAITHRWGSFGISESRAEGLHAHTLRLVGFQAERVPSEIEVKEKSRVTCTRYVRPAQGSGGVVSVTSGPPGAVSTHTPDVCYPGSGYKTVVAPRRETLELPGGQLVSYYVAEFEKKTATRTERHRVRWTWSTPGSTTWSAPDNPRLDYFYEQELYKLYVVTPTVAPEAGRSTEDSPADREFVATAFAQYTELLAGR